MKTAWLFPGQGSQYAGMGRQLLKTCSRTLQILKQAEEIAGLRLRKVIIEGPEILLMRPDILEVALTTISLGYANLLLDAGLRPDCVAGYSAGEAAAFACAGVLTTGNALYVSAMRGKVLARFASPATAMSAISHISAATVERIVTDFQSQGVIAIAGWNTPRDTTITGDAMLVRSAEREALRLGSQVSSLRVCGPWHCSAVRDAVGETVETIARIPFGRPTVPVYVSLTGQSHDDPEVLRTCIAEQIAQPVLWQNVLTGMSERGVQVFVETGPGRVLTAFVKKFVELRGGVTAQFVDRQNSRPIPVETFLKQVSKR